MLNHMSGALSEKKIDTKPWQKARALQILCIWPTGAAQVTVGVAHSHSQPNTELERGVLALIAHLRL